MAERSEALERIAGEKMPCRDAEQRVWRAIDVLSQRSLGRGRAAATGEEQPNPGGSGEAQLAAYGYRLVRRTESSAQRLEVDEAEGEGVRWIYRWLMEERLSSRAVTRRLNERNIPTRGGGERGWRQSTVLKVLTDPMYKGQGYWNRRQAADAHQPFKERGYKDRGPGNGRSGVLRPEAEWIAVRVPAIIDPETWQSGQEQLEQNRRSLGLQPGAPRRAIAARPGCGSPVRHRLVASAGGRLPPRACLQP